MNPPVSLRLSRCKYRPGRPGDGDPVDLWTRTNEDLLQVVVAPCRTFKAEDNVLRNRTDLDRLTHRIHVWYICYDMLTFGVYIDGIYVIIYNIHGSYGL